MKVEVNRAIITSQLLYMNAHLQLLELLVLVGNVNSNNFVFRFHEKRVREAIKKNVLHFLYRSERLASA